MNEPNMAHNKNILLLIYPRKLYFATFLSGGGRHFCKEIKCGIFIYPLAPRPGLWYTIGIERGTGTSNEAAALQGEPAMNEAEHCDITKITAATPVAERTAILAGVIRQCRDCGQFV